MDVLFTQCFVFIITYLFVQDLVEGHLGLHSLPKPALIGFAKLRSSTPIILYSPKLEKERTASCD